MLKKKKKPNWIMGSRKPNSHEIHIGFQIEI